MPLVAADTAIARKMVAAAKPMVEDIKKDRLSGKLLAIASYPP